MQPTRRDAIAFLAGSALVFSTAERRVLADRKKHKDPRGAPSGVPPGQHPIVPLPFDPKRLAGISERMIVSHHENNYSGAVKNLNKVELELANVTAETPGFTVASLRERELLYANSMILHERYFANLGGDGKLSGAIEKALASAYGSLARWEESFRATALALGGGSGWAIVDYDFHSGDVRTYACANHTQSPAFAMPILVLDMYEHSYALDYGAAHAKYIDAFFANVSWDEVNRRLDRARKAAKALAA